MRSVERLKKIVAIACQKIYSNPGKRFYSEECRHFQREGNKRSTGKKWFVNGFHKFPRIPVVNCIINFSITKLKWKTQLPIFSSEQKRFNICGGKKHVACAVPDRKSGRVGKECR